MKTLKDILPGQTVGRYEFLVPIAQGGMASVWAARQRGSRGFSKTVAVKTMLPTVSDDPKFEQMFLDEARIASRIRHPNVAEILDLGEQDDVLYLVMEWVDGEALSSLRRAAVEQGQFPLPIAVKVVADACAGLHAAHEVTDEDGNPVGLVHRDISPQNILVGYDGRVKLVDFGVAKMAGRVSETTHTGHAKGKPPYMSPEQALGKAIDRRTDLFALGIVLYQMATGRHPLRGENDVATLHNIVSDQPVLPPGVFDPDFPPKLERTILRALERNPERRFQTARELEFELEEVMESEVGRARTEDVGRFVTELLGARGEERRQALKNAIRAADERAVSHLGMIPDSPTVVDVQHVRGGSMPDDSARSSGVDFERATRAGLRPGRWWALWALVAIFGVSAVLMGWSLLTASAGAAGSGPEPTLARTAPSVAPTAAILLQSEGETGGAPKTANSQAPSEAGAATGLAAQQSPKTPAVSPRRRSHRRAPAVQGGTSFQLPPITDPGF